MTTGKLLCCRTGVFLSSLGSGKATSTTCLQSSAWGTLPPEEPLRGNLGAQLCSAGRQDLSLTSPLCTAGHTKWAWQSGPGSRKGTGDSLPAADTKLRYGQSNVPFPTAKASEGLGRCPHQEPGLWPKELRHSRALGKQPCVAKALPKKAIAGAVC